jgi:hypothetical protein
MNRQPQGKHRQTYSPVLTPAASLYLLGLMGSLAFEQRARSLALFLDHLTEASARVVVRRKTDTYRPAAYPQRARRNEHGPARVVVRRKTDTYRPGAYP